MIIRSKILEVAYANFAAKCQNSGRDAHLLNAKILVEKSTSIPEHTDFMSSLTQELRSVSEYQDLIDALDMMEEFV